MKLERREVFPVPPTTLIAALTDKACYEARFRMQDSAADFELWQQTSEGLRVRVTKQIPVRADRLPAMLRHFVSPQMPLHHEYFWRGHQPGMARERAHGECRMWLGRVPASLEGRIEIHGQGDQSEQRMTLELVSRIPMLGKKVLDKAAERINFLLDEDHQTILDWLAQRP